MSDKSEDQMSIEDSMPDTSKSPLFKEVEDLAKSTITEQKCCQNLEVLIQVETDAVGLRKLLEKKVEKKS